MTIGGGARVGKEETQALIKETAKFTAEELQVAARISKNGWSVLFT